MDRAKLGSGVKKGIKKRSVYMCARERKEEWVFSQREKERNEMLARRERGKHMKAWNWTSYKDGVGL